jgi:trigger factor
MTLAASGCGNTVGDGTVSTETASADEDASSGSDVVSASRAFMDIKGSDYVTLCDYSAIEVTITGDYDVTDDDVTEYFSQMFSSYGPFYMVDDTKTVVEEGDIVNVDYVGTLDGEAFSGGTATSQNVDVSGNCAAGSTSTYIPGFTDGLLGAAVGDTIDCDVTFPDTYSNTDLAGKAVVFTFTVNSIQKEMEFSDVDDSFAQEQFGVDTLDEVYEQVESYLLQVSAYYKTQDTMSAIQDYLIDNCTVDMPEDFAEARYDDYIRTFVEEELGGDESQLSDYAEQSGYTVEELEAEWRQNVDDTVKIQLIMDAIAEEMGLTIDETAYSEYVEQLISSGTTYGYYSDEDAMYEYYGYGDKVYGESYLRSLYLYDQALEDISENATVTVVPETEPDDTDVSDETGTDGTE